MKTFKQPAIFIPVLILLAGLLLVIIVILIKEVGQGIRPFYPFLAFVYLININYLLWELFLKKK